MYIVKYVMDLSNESWMGAEDVRHAKTISPRVISLEGNRPRLPLNRCLHTAAEEVHHPFFISIAFFIAFFIEFLIVENNILS